MALMMFATLVAYFLLLLLISRHTSRKHNDNDAFFRASRRSPWWMVGFGMIGASISGVSFISVPGWVASTGMTYLQMCAGFFFGYLVVAFVLLPLYYRLKLTSIYSYLESRFGPHTHRTGAFFFILSKLTGAAARLFLVCLVLQQFIIPTHSDSLPVFILLAAAVLTLIWLYTRHSGLFSIVRTDALQTLCLLLALVGMLFMAANTLHLNFFETVDTIRQSDYSQIFCWDATSKQNFWRQFLSGIFIVIVMTGLDQDMMQKNLTCRNLREAQKNMCAYGACFLPVNLLLLALGILLYTLCAARGIQPPSSGDALLPMLVSSGALGFFFVIPFCISIVAAAFSSADSAITSLTTSVCIDLLHLEDRVNDAERQRKIRRRIHLSMCLAFLLCIIIFRALNDTSVINAIYVMASYTYGPLLGLYAFGLFTRQAASDFRVPYVCIAAPLICALLDWGAPRWWQYTFGYELLMLNGLITFVGLLVFCRKRQGTF